MPEAAADYAASAASGQRFSILSLRVASLRHFATDGDFAVRVQNAVQAPLPSVPGSVHRGSCGTILAWRSPTETLMFCKQVGPIEALASATASATDGCLIDLSGGVCVFALGAADGALLSRLGGQGIYPSVAQAKTARIAEVSVFLMRIDAEQILMSVDRAYAAHLQAWMRSSAQNLLLP